MCSQTWAPNAAWGGPGQVSTPQVAAVPLADVGPRGLQAWPQALRACPSGRTAHLVQVPGPAPWPCPWRSTAPPWAHAMRICPSGALESRQPLLEEEAHNFWACQTCCPWPQPSDHITRAAREMLRPEPAQRKFLATEPAQDQDTSIHRNRAVHTSTHPHTCAHTCTRSPQSHTPTDTPRSHKHALTQPHLRTLTHTMHTCTHDPTVSHSHTHVHTRTHHPAIPHLHVFTRVHTRVFTHAHSPSCYCTRVHTCVHTHVFTRVHNLAVPHLHTHMHSPPSPPLLHTCAYMHSRACHPSHHVRACALKIHSPHPVHTRLNSHPERPRRRMEHSRPHLAR